MIVQKSRSSINLQNSLLTLLFLTFHMLGYGQTTLPEESPSPQKKVNTAQPVSEKPSPPLPKADGSILITFDTRGELKIDGISKGEFEHDDVWQGSLTPGAHLIMFSDDFDSYKEIHSIVSEKQSIIEIELLPLKFNRDPAFKLEVRAETGDSEAQYELGIEYLEGISREKNTEEAKFWISKSANQGHAQAQLNLGNLYWGEDFEKAWFWYDKSADKFSAEEQYNLGKSCQGKGLGGSLKALFWYEKSAQRGYGLGQYGLGYLYFHGPNLDGLNVDFNKAFFWLSKAAEQGVVESYTLLGRIYERGLGDVDKSVEKAQYWKNKD